MKLVLGGKQYELEKVARRISVWQYLELEEQAGITVDDLQRGEDANGKKLSSARTLVAYAFLIRRHNGEDISFREVAEQLVPEDMVVAEDDGGAQPVPPKAPPASARGAKGTRQRA